MVSAPSYTSLWMVLPARDISRTGCSMAVACMQSLCQRHTYLSGLVRYVELCVAWRPTILYLAEQPYAAHLLPELPAAFAYNDHCDMPESVMQMLRFIRPEDKHHVCAMLKHSWAALWHGIAFLNADYLVPDPECPVSAVCRREQMVHLIAGHILGHARVSDCITLVAIGTNAHACARKVSAMLHARGASCTSHFMKQPVAAARQGVTDAQIEAGEFSIFNDTRVKQLIVTHSRMCSQLCHRAMLATVYVGLRKPMAAQAAMPSKDSIALSGMVSSMRAIMDAVETSPTLSKDEFLRDAIRSICTAVCTLAQQQGTGVATSRLAATSMAMHGTRPEGITVPVLRTPAKSTRSGPSTASPARGRSPLGTAGSARMLSLQADLDSVVSDSDGEGESSSKGRALSTKSEEASAMHTRKTSAGEAAPPAAHRRRSQGKAEAVKSLLDSPDGEPKSL